MLARIRNWLAPPIFRGDDDKTRIARQVHILLLWLLGGVSVYIVVLPVLLPERASRLYFVAPLFVLFGTSFILNRRGYIRWASLLLIIGLWTVLTVAAAVSGGVRASAAPVYVIIVLYAGLLFGPRLALGVAGWCALTGLALIIAEAVGWLPVPTSPVSPLAHWLAQTLTFIWTAGLFYLAFRDIHKAPGQAEPNVGAILVNSRDITDRKDAEQHDRQRHAMLARVIQLGKDVTQTTDLRECLLRIQQSLRTGLGFDRAAVYLYDAQAQVLRGTFGTTRTGALDELWETALSLTADDPSRRILGDPNGFLHTLDYTADHHLAADDPDPMTGVREHVGVAAWAGDAPKAVLWADNLLTGRAMSNAQLEALRLFAGYAGLAIAHAQSHTALHRAAERQKILHAIDHAILAAQSPDAIAAAALPRIRALCPCERASLLLFDETAQQVIALAVSTEQETRMGAGGRRPLQSLRAAHVLQHQPYALVDDMAELTERTSSDEQLLLEGLRAHLALPLRASGQLIGSLNLAAARPKAFTADDIELVAEVANQIAIAIQQSRLLAETAEALAREERLNEIARVINGALDPEAVIPAIVRLTAELLAAESSAAYLLSPDGETLVMPAAFNYPAHFPQFPQSKADGGLNWFVMETGQPLRLERYAAHPHARAQWADICAFMCVPILVGDACIGTLEAFSLNPAHHFSERDLALMESIGRQAGTAIQNARLFEAEQRRVALLTAVRETGLDISTQLELPEVLRVIMERVLRLMNVSMGSLYLLRSDQTLEVVVNQNIPGVAVGMRLRLGEGLSGRVAQTKEPMVVADYSQWPGRAAVFDRATVRAVLAVPILWQDEVLGVINLLDERPGHFNQTDAEPVRLLAAQAAIAIRNAQLFDSTRRQLAELTVLHSAALAIVEAENEDGLIERLTRFIGESFLVEDFGVLLVDSGAGVLRLHPSYRGRRENPPVEAFPLGQHVVGAVAARGQAWRVADVTHEPNYYPANPTTRSEICVPLKVGERVLGVINAESPVVGAFSEADERLLVTLAGQAAIALERLRGQAKEARRRQWLEKVIALGKAVNQISNLRSCLQTIHTSVQQGLAFDRVGLFLYNASAHIVQGAIGTDNHGARVDLSDFVGRLEDYEGFNRLLQTPTELIYVPDFAAAYTRRDPSMEGVKEHAMMAAWAGDEPVGVITADNRVTQRPMTEEQLEGLRLFAGYAGLAIQNARWNEELEQRVDERTLQLQASEAALRRTEDLYRRAITAADAVPYERHYDAETFSFMGEEIVNLTGYSAQEMTTRLWDALPQESVMRGEAAGLSLVEAAPRTRAGEFQRWRADYHIRTRDGHMRWIADASVELRDPTGQSVGAIGILTDVTDRRRDEQRTEIVGNILRQLNATLQIAEVFSSISADLRVITGCQRVSLIVFDEAHTWYTALFLYPPHEEPKPGVRARVANPAFLQNLLAGRPHVIRDLQQQAVSPVEATLLELGYRSILSLPLRRSADTMGALNLSWREPGGYHDIDQLMLEQIASALALALERSRLFDEAQERTRELEAANRELESFSYSISHDLRAPLRAMNGFSHLLLEGHSANLNADGQAYLKHIRDGAQRMGQLIDDLLRFSRLGRQPVHKQTLYPAEVARQVLADVIQPNYPAHNVEIHIGELPPCQADPTLLRQVFINLLDNAFKYSQKRANARIEIGWTGQAYFVRDNGAGFDMRYAHRLFGVFQRLHSVEEFEGTGVGLAIVSRILQRHGGHIWADAEVGRGATFFFALVA